ncbi:MAG: aminomethyl-transferring glycine dehydrogenase subunit GcvPA [Bacteroidales bacterium]
MSDKNDFVHPYIPNSEPSVKAEMLKEIGVKDIEELYEDIPERLRFRKKMNLPEPLLSEIELRKHFERLLSKNKTCKENISFLGGGCYNHYVPAICDEINGRSEFLTAYAGEPYEDHGRFHSLFEYESLMAEMLDFDVVNVPTYDWTQAASTSLRMAGRITKRSEVLVSEIVSPDRFAAIKNYIKPVMKITKVEHDVITGLMNIDDLKSKINQNIAAVYFENPSYFGIIETQGEIISEIAHQNGALSVVGVDPSSLGLLKPPSQYGADIACGDIQSLGIHMYYGGATGGFISTRDEEKFVMEYPSRLFGITKTAVEGEWGFDDVAYGRTSFAHREEGKEFVGTASALWGITAGSYLALMGPKGMQELNQHILQKSQYAQKKLSQVKDVSIRFKSACFKEFVVDFSATQKTVKEINKALLAKGIFGGKDLTHEFPDLKNCALYAVTEMVSKDDIDALTVALTEILK